MLSDTESSFNKITKEIINSPLCGAYAFIEKVSDPKIAVVKKIKTHKEQTACSIEDI